MRKYTFYVFYWGMESTGIDDTEYIFRDRNGKAYSFWSERACLAHAIREERILTVPYFDYDTLSTESLEKILLDSSVYVVFEDGEDHPFIGGEDEF